MTDLSGNLSDLGYAAGWRLVRAMPEPLARSVFGAGARYASLGGGPEQLRRNLARVIGTTPDAVPDAVLVGIRLEGRLPRGHGVGRPTGTCVGLAQEIQDGGHVSARISASGLQMLRRGGRLSQGEFQASQLHQRPRAKLIE